jgi:hypothetical protein
MVFVLPDKGEYNGHYLLGTFPFSIDVQWFMYIFQQDMYMYVGDVRLPPNRLKPTLLLEEGLWRMAV